ncbi:hypothetical protein SADUNF_Sadunf17G0061400 [Salix dunnii]|uniref:Transmembrane protein n=1 Tax=Salix dunnii TaxID=1413687 RepID=A0A835JA24_9ROSI|nr:hypothetical protein SADUNF_Sadunf17G0061400 [Salix dunnii]
MSADWGPVVVAVILFIVLSPGLLFQLPARTRVVEFGNMYTSGISILVHAVIYFCIITILVIAIDVNMSSQDENRIDSEKDESMNSYSHAIRLQTPKLHLLAVTWYLKQKTRLVISFKKQGIFKGKGQALNF